jgi:hypothetical protein
MGLPLPTKAPAGDGSVTETKKALVQERALQKMALLGTEEERRTIATAELQGNALADAPEIQDIRELDPVSFAAKYGHEAERLRAEYARSMMELEGLKARRRTTAETAGDAALDAVRMGVNTAGGVGVLGFNILDEVSGTTLSPRASEALDAAGEALGSRQSPLMQERRAQHGLEAELDSQDREARDAARREAVKNEPSAWDRAIRPTLVNWGEGFAETVENYADDPIMLGSLAPEAIGSMIPMAVGARALGKAAALKELRRRGLTDQAAEASLQTAEGRALLEASTLRVAPVVAGVAETGGAVNQAQLDILGQDETSLGQSPAYQALRTDGLSHEEAQMRLAREAGSVAGVAAAPGALAAGRLAGGMVAYPMRVGGRIPLAGAALNVGREGLEETLQEANAQLATNVGAQAIGLERDLDKGVAEAAAQGMLGGVAAGVTLQAPGAVMNGLVQAGSATLGAGRRAATDLITRREARLAAEREASSPVGAQARTEAGSTLQTSGEALMATLSEPVLTAPSNEDATPNQGAPNETPSAAPSAADAAAVTAIVSKIDEGLYASEADVSGLSQVHEGAAALLATNPDTRLTRAQALEFTADMMDAAEAAGESSSKAMMALGVLQQLEAMRRIGASEIVAYVEALPAESPVRNGFEAMRTSLATLEASPRVRAAIETIEELTAEDLNAFLPIELIADPEADPEMQAAVAGLLQTVLAVNPTVLGARDYERVLNQEDGENGAAIPEAVLKALIGARDAARIFEEAAEAKSAIEEENPGYRAGDLVSQQDIVSEEIRVRGNSRNNLPSLREHRGNVVVAALSGRNEEAMDALQDLRDFAQTLANKVGAMNVSAAPGESFGKRVGYEAFGPYGQFFSNDAVFVNLKSEKSLGLARAAHADATAAAKLVNVLAEQFGMEVAPVEVPALAKAIGGPKPAEKPAPRTKRMIQRKRTPRPAPKPVSEATERKLASQLEKRRRELRVEALRTAYRKARAARNKAEKALKGVDPESPDYAEAEREALEREATLQRLDDEIRDLGGEVPVTKPRAKSKPESSDEAAPEATAEEVEKPDAVSEVFPEASLEVVPEVEDAPRPKEAREAVETENAETDAPATETEDASAGDVWFERLKKGLPRNWEGKQALLGAFRSAGNGSRLVEASDPIEWLDQDLEMSGLPSEQIRSLQAILRRGFPEFVEKMEAAIAAHMAAKGLEGAPEKLTRALSFPESLPLNLVVDDGVTAPHLEPKVMAAAFLATFEWLAQHAKKPRALDAEDMNAMLGLSRGDAISRELEAALLGGHLQMGAQEAIAASMLRLLDLQPKRGADIRLSQGLLRSVAVNALELLMDVQGENGAVTEPRILAWTMARYVKDGAPHQAMVLQVRPEFAENPDFQVLVKLRAPFTERLTEGRVRDRFIGEGVLPGAPSQTRMHNRLARLSRQEIQAVERLQAMPAFVNVPMVALVRALGLDAYKALQGYVPLTEETRANHNPMHLLSIEGRNQTIEHDLDETLAYVEEVERLASPETGAAGVPIRFAWGVSSVGRLQQQGPVTPQGSKIARELISSTNATLELTGPNADRHEWALWAAVAQALDLKIERMSRDDIPVKAQRHVYESYGEAVKLLEGFERAGRLDPKAFAASVGGAISTKGLHALLTVARFNVARGDGAERFETALALEADGKTDGPVNAMIHMGMGEFRPEELELFAKGGLFFRDRPTSLADYIALEGKGGEDIYHMAAARFELGLNAAIAAKTSSGSSGSLGTLGVLDAFLPAFELKDAAKGTKTKEALVGRNVIKNPLTVFLYGSGDAGIAGKVARQVEESIGEFLSELIANDKKGLRIREHPLLLENPELLGDLAEVLFSGNMSQLETWLKKPQEAVFTPKMQTALRERILAEFVEPMVEAIDATTGGLQGKMKFLQAAAEIQTLVFQATFQEKVATAQAAKDATLEPMREAEKQAAAAEGRKPRKIAKALLSEQEVRDVFAETMKLAPIYGNDVQEFHISAPEKTNDPNVTVATSFTGRLKAVATYVAPADASVKVSPYLTIGNGDGRMILNIYTKGTDVFETSLPVFDGVEMGLDVIGEASRQINAQTFAAWQAANPYRDVRKGFATMLAQLSDARIATLPVSVQKRIAMLGKRYKVVGDLRDVLQSFDQTLELAAQERAARVAVMKRAGISADHMAGAQEPSFQEGKALLSGDPTDFGGVAAMLNGLYVEELTQIEASAAAGSSPRETASGYAQAPTAELEASLRQIGQAVDGHPELIEVSARELMRLLQGPVAATGATVEQQSLAKELATLGELPATARVFFGSTEALVPHRDSQGEAYAGGALQLGQSIMGGPSDLVYVANMAPETALHELLHLYTDRILVDHYQAPESSAPHVRHAVSQLEKLMADAMELTTFGLNAPDAKALRVLQSIVRGYEGDRASQIGEFVSYVLSNPGLIAKTKTTPSYQGLTSVVSQAMRWIKRLLGIKGAPGATLYSNVRFNARLLLAQEPAWDAALIRDEATRALEQVYGEDSRLNVVENLYLGRLANLLRGMISETTPEAARGRISAKILEARQMAARAAAYGLELNFRELSAFEAVYAAASSGLAVGKPVRRHIEEALNHVATMLSPETVLRAMGVETPNEATPAQQLRAKQVTAFFAESGKQGGDQLAAFLGLSQTSPLMRAILGSMKPPRTVELRWNSVDAWMQSLGRALVNLITRLSLSPRLTKENMGAELDALSGALTAVERSRFGLAQLQEMSGFFGQGVEAANAYVAEKISTGAKKATEALNEMGQAAERRDASKPVRGLIQTLQYAASLGSSETANATGAALSKMLNDAEGWHTLRSLYTDVRGMNDDNAPLWRLINPAKAKIDSMRQDSREGIPRHLAAAFTKRLEPEIWSAMHRGLAKTDLLALGHEATLALLGDPRWAQREIRKLEAQLDKEVGSGLAGRYMSKAKALAVYMTTGRNTSQNLLANAYAIAHLLGEALSKGKALTPSDDVVSMIDRLTSLYAWMETDQATRDQLGKLAAVEPEGLQAVTGFLRVARASEITRRDRHGGINRVALHNGWKGYAPATPKEGHAVVVRPVKDHDDLLSRGYVQIGVYRGDGNDMAREPLAYYQSTVTGRGAFRQGVAQTVNDTWQGVDARSGLTLDGTSAGTLLGAGVSRIAQKLRRASPGSLDGLKPGEYLRPIFDEGGNVAAYERTMDPEKTALVEKDDHLGRMLGVWVGRILEEELADKVNQELVETLKGIYDQARKNGELRGFVNVADPKQKDPVVRDAFATMGWRMRRDIEDAFGQGEFWVRQDMVDDAIGFRQATVTDPWTGVSRWSPETQAKMRKVAELIAGNDAFKRLRQGDRILREGVAWAKETIIVRSLVVTVQNVLSNVAHLLVVGVPISDVLSGSRNKFAEVTTYVQNREEIQKLQVQMAGVLKNPAAMRRLETRVELLEAANSKLSIQPLLEAGELNTIAEGLDEADIAIRNGKLGEFFSWAADRLPETAKTVAKNLAITKDTALYQGLIKGVQYGDFIAKAVLYDHLTKTRGMSREAALDRIMEEFVPYNRLAGRSRDLLESMGLAWFLNYKLRILPVVARTLRERPLSAMTMFAGGDALLGVQTIWDGSALGSALDGRLGYAFGPEMGLNSPTLHPVGALVL